MQKQALLVGILALTACGPAFIFKASGPERAAKGPMCEFSVVTATPAPPYEKIGIFEIQYDNTGFIDKPETLKRKIQADMCKVGGDAVQPHENSYGTYIKATVFATQAAAQEGTEISEDESSGSEASSDGLAGL